MVSRFLNRTVVLLGQRMPVVPVALAGTVLGVSVLGAICDRAGVHLVEAGLFVPALIYQGQVWRLFTWVFFDRDFNLIFGCYALIWVGADLVRAWGGARFLATCAAIVGTAAGATCLLAFPWRVLMTTPNAGIWALVDALIIAWASLSPGAIVQLFFVLPVPSRSIPLVIIGMTVVLALMNGIPFFVPHLIAQGLALAYVRDFTLRNLWLRMRYATLERQMRRSHLREVKRGDDPRWYH